MKSIKNPLFRTGIIAATLATALVCQRAQANNLFGIDVSSYQGSINWSDVKGNGANYAYAKATEGTYYQDPDFKANMANGKAAGLQMGAYHFARPDIDCPASDATYFWDFAGSYITDDHKSIYPMVDFETFNGADCVADYTAWMNDWGADVNDDCVYYLHPVIYCSACSGACDLIQYNESGGIALSAWIADYNGENLYTGNPWSTCDCCNAWVSGCGTGNWTYWQVSSSGTIGGVSGGCDFDAYAGTLSDLESWQGVQ
ncbi:MAG TPA: glycoside hydrolase family 25 protein [Verrucomicrobiae bacterium]|jgi:lysozyme